jgi:membrane-bound lytic murein transglycosylase D
LVVRSATFAFFLLLGGCATAWEPGSSRDLELGRPTTAEPQLLPTVRSLDLPSSNAFEKYQLPIQYNERVAEFVELYARRNRKTFALWLTRMGRYRQLVEQELAEHALPRELVYVPLIESAYEASAGSYAGAAGLWQFMRGTARSEGLEVSEYVDERRDPIRSTQAAVRHLSRLYNQFGSWYLASAAYNSGSTRIAKLLKERGYTKASDDVYWELLDALPKETRDYLPMLLAAVIVSENADSFGIAAAPQEPWQFEEVRVPGATELRAVARAAGTTLEEIRALNPQHIKSMTPPGRYSNVRVPIGAAADFSEAFSKIPKEERRRTLTP